MSRPQEARLDGLTLRRVSAALQRVCGIAIAPSLMQGLEGAVQAAAAQLSIDPAEFLQRLEQENPASLNALIEHSVIGETHFLRHPEHFRALTEIVPHLLREGESLRIWSAGCSFGEEPYSLGLSLISSGHSSNSRILATDVSERSLARARLGLYGEWSFRGVSPSVRTTYFQPQGPLWKIKPEVQQLVDFQRHNLVRQGAPGGFHVVFCRNVLIYFEGEHLERVLESLVSALLPGGLLFVGPAEVPKTATLPLERLETGGAFIFRKADGPPLKLFKPNAPTAKIRVIARPAAAPAAVPAPAPKPLILPVSPSAVEQPPTKSVVKLPQTDFERAVESARAGRLEEAELLAGQVAENELLPEAFLLLAMTAENRGELAEAVGLVRRALFLDSTLPAAHAALAALYQQLGNAKEAEQARRNALEALRGLDDDTILRGVEETTAGSLRLALSHRAAPSLHRSGVRTNER